MNKLKLAKKFIEAQGGFTGDADAVIQKQQIRIVELESFVRKFLGNFEECTLCDLGLDAALQICSKCEGTGKQIDSRGVLFVELPDEARKLLKEQS